MGRYWHIEDHQGSAAFADAYPDLAAVEAEPGRLFNGAPDADCRVFVRELGDRRYFIKHYRAGAWSWRNLLATSKVRHEWNNLHYFRRLGIQTPVPVAIGELRRYGVFSRGVLVTEEVVGAIDLAKLASSQPAYLHDRVWYAELCRQLALPLKTLHDTGFAHNDLNWRNVLLTLEPLSVYFFDCPSGRRWFWPFRKFRLTKDLTHLDKMGRRYLSRTQRLRFYLTYAGHARLDPRDKRWLKQVLNREVSGKYQPEAQ